MLVRLLHLKASKNACCFLDWIHTGNVGKLEELVLNGYADLLLGRAHQVAFFKQQSFYQLKNQLNP